MLASMLVTLADPKNSLGLEAVTLMALSLSLLSFSTVVVDVLKVVVSLCFSVVVSSVVLGSLSVEEAEKSTFKKPIYQALLSNYSTFEGC